LLGKICESRRAKIEIYQQHNILRITADKTTAEYAADDIEKALKSVVTRKLQLKPWISSLEKNKVPQDEKVATLYTDDDFNLVNSLTRAVIQRMDNSNTVRV
jgi:predicted flavoprotein YhiN